MAQREKIDEWNTIKGPETKPHNWFMTCDLRQSYHCTTMEKGGSFP